MRLRRQTRRLFEEMSLSLSLFFAFSNSFFFSPFFLFFFFVSFLLYLGCGSPPFAPLYKKKDPKRRPKKKGPRLLSSLSARS